jgi:hypothetical protein
MKPSRAALRERLPELALLASIALLLVLGFRLADGLPSWHEIVSSLPNHGPHVLRSARPGAPIEGPLPLAPSCSDADAPLFAVSSTRPHLSLCASGEALPIMVSPYASGLQTWPLALFHALHHDDTFVLRKLWLCVAAFSLWLTYRLVTRIADRPAAALVSVLTAASSPFLIMNALLVPFETVPCMLVVAALSVWSGCAALAPGAAGDAETSPGRLVGGALLAGLAVGANVKATFFLAPLALLALRSGVRFRAVRARHAAAMLAAFVLPLLPMLIFARLDPQHGLRAQVSFRAASLVDNVRLSRFVSEPLLLLNFASDFLSIFDMAARREPVRPSWVHAAVAVPIGYTMIVGAARLLGRAWGSALAAAAGAVILTYFFVSVLLYRQYPGGNYAPLHDVFGVAMAAGVVDLARALRGALDRRAVGGPGAIAVASSGAAILVIGSLWNVLRRGDPAAYVRLSFNAAAQRAAAAYLRAAPDAERPILSTTYNLAGVFDALGHGRLRAVQVHEHLERCDGRPDLDACLRERWRFLLAREGVPPVRVIAPLVIGAVDKPAEVIARLEPTLFAASAELGLDARVEERFTTAAGEPVLALYRVDGSPRVPRQIPAPPPSPEPGCGGGIDAATTRAIFEGLRGDAGDGCQLEGVSTERSRMLVRWSKDGATTEPAVVVPRACGPEDAVRGKALAMTVPPAVAAACPAGVRRLRALIE